MAFHRDSAIVVKGVHCVEHVAPHMISVHQNAMRKFAVEQRSGRLGSGACHVPRKMARDDVMLRAKGFQFGVTMSIGSTSDCDSIQADASSVTAMR